MKRLYILLTGLLIGASCIQAQEPQKNEAQLDRTIVVENLYNPDIMNANKISLLPTLEEPQMNKKQIEYATSTKPAKQFGFAPMSNFGFTPQQSNDKNGYLRVGYGNRGNIDGRLSYRLEWGKRDVVNANINFRGMNGTIRLPESIEETDKWDTRTYHTLGSIDWKHNFNPFTLLVEAEGENQVYNYMNLNPWINNTHQHNAMGSLKATIKNYNNDDRIRYTVGTGLLYAKQKYAFGYYDNSYTEPYAETIIRSHALVTGVANEHTSIHIAAQMDNIFANPGGRYNQTNQTILQLNPYVTKEGENWKARIGLHVNPLFGNGGADFSLAPDLYGEYSLRPGYTAYLLTGGGHVVNDFRHVNSFDPYAEFPIYKEYKNEVGYYAPKHTFHQLDSRLGFKTTPINELALHLYVGYRITENQLYSTRFTDYNYGDLGRLMQDDANRFYVGASAQYAWKDILTTQVSLEWNKWNSDLLDKYSTLTPATSFQWNANIHLIEHLHVGVNYQFEQYMKDMDGNRPHAKRDLGLTATYCLYDKLSLYATGNNLLNQKYYEYMLQPTQGFNILLGAILNF